MDTQEQARNLMMRHHHLVKQRQQSMLGRSAGEVGMDGNGTEYWTHIQGKPASASSLSYYCSHATMS